MATTDIAAEHVSSSDGAAIPAGPPRIGTRQPHAGVATEADEGTRVER